MPNNTKFTQETVYVFSTTIQISPKAQNEVFYEKTFILETPVSNDS